MFDMYSILKTTKRLRSYLIVLDIDTMFLQNT